MSYKPQLIPRLKLATINFIDRIWNYYYNLDENPLPYTLDNWFEDDTLVNNFKYINKPFSAMTSKILDVFISIKEFIVGKPAHHISMMINPYNVIKLPQKYPDIKLLEACYVEYNSHYEGGYPYNTIHRISSEIDLYQKVNDDASEISLKRNELEQLFIKHNLYDYELEANSNLEPYDHDSIYRFNKSISEKTKDLWVEDSKFYIAGVEYRKFECDNSKYNFWRNYSKLIGRKILDISEDFE